MITVAKKVAINRGDDVKKSQKGEYCEKLWLEVSVPLPGVTPPKLLL